MADDAGRFGHSLRAALAGGMLAGGMLAGGLLAGGLLAGPALAQTDPEYEAAMEVQRCVWRCLADSQGADDPAYNQCTETRCTDEALADMQRSNGGPVWNDPNRSAPQQSTAPQTQSPAPAPQANAAPPGTQQPAATGVWTIGQHPQLGPSAYLQMQGGAIGFVCYATNGPADANVMGLRVTSSLFFNPAMTVMFDTDSSAFTLRSLPGQPFAERRGTTCDMNLNAFSTAGNLILVEGEIARIEAAGTGNAPGTEITIRQDGVEAVVSGGSDATRKLYHRSVPLAGARQALEQLVAQCPAARADIAADCGL